jgi:chemotaxis protein histidine kinase CheA
LPGEFRHGDTLLKAEYKRLDNRRVMVVLTDVTEERRLQEKVAAERRRLEMIVAAVTDGRDFFDTVEAFREFVADGLPAILGAPADPTLIAKEIYRQVHTFKGLLNQFSFPGTPAALHDLESRLEGLRKSGREVSRQDLSAAVQAMPFKALLDADLAVLSDALGPQFMECGDRVVLSAAQAEQLRQLAEQLLRGEPVDTTIGGMRRLLVKIGQLHKVPLKDVLTGFDRLIKQTAIRLEKEVVPLQVLGDTEVWIDPQAYRPFLRSLTHVFRNAVVHGIEDPATRLQMGKEETGNITCSVHADADCLKLSIADDGAGINIEGLRQRAVAAGLFEPGEIAAVPDEQIADLIFLDNIGTQQETTEFAGRGVGLAAVRGETRNIKGQVTVRTTAGQGTQFEFTLPFQTDMIQQSGTSCLAEN